MAKDVARQIEWSEASVDESGTLSVALLGEWDEDWNSSFEEILAMLMRETRGGTWGRITLIRDAIAVDNVEEGSEVSLKEFLESVVQQANSDVSRRKQRKDEARAKAEAEAASRESSAKAMTDKFRGFGSN
jgi:Fe2+ transport system protein B